MTTSTMVKIAGIVCRKINPDQHKLDLIADCSSVLGSQETGDSLSDQLLGMNKPSWICGHHIRHWPLTHEIVISNRPLSNCFVLLISVFGNTIHASLVQHVMQLQVNAITSQLFCYVFIWA